MDYKDIIARQAQKILDLEDKLAESAKSSSYWYDECQRMKAEYTARGDSDAG